VSGEKIIFFVVVPDPERGVASAVWHSYLCPMELQKKKFTFRGMDGYAGFRHGQDYEVQTGKTDEGEYVIINPVSQVWMYFSPPVFAEKWQPKK
jgi:hypothetical protein